MTRRNRHRPGVRARRETAIRRRAVALELACLLTAERLALPRLHPGRLARLVAAWGLLLWV